MVFSQTHGRAFEEESGRFGRGNFSVYFVVSSFSSLLNGNPGESIAILAWKTIQFVFKMVIATCTQIP